MARKQISDDVWRSTLNRLVLKPRLKAAARAEGINPATLFTKIKRSIASPDEHRLTWLDTLAPFHEHVSAARRLSIVELDQAALQLGLEGHSTPRYHDGKPCFVVDLAVAADALTLDELSWIDKYGTRRGPGPDADTYARDADNKLIQEMVTSPPNAQLVSKLLSSLIPAYSERSTVEHHHSGSVWIEGQTTQPQLPSSSHGIIDVAFNVIPAAQQQRPNNLLALPRPCVDTAEFEAKYRSKRLLRVVTLFRDAEGHLLPPLPSDVVVAGSRQHLAFSDAQIPVEAVRAETLLDEGYQNDFLYELAPAWKPKKPKPPTDAERAEIAKQAAVEMAKEKEKPYRSMEDRAEGIGAGTPPPGGRRVSP